jgi:hypothetical protein
MHARAIEESALVAELEQQRRGVPHELTFFENSGRRVRLARRCQDRRRAGFTRESSGINSRGVERAGTPRAFEYIEQGPDDEF